MQDVLDWVNTPSNDYTWDLYFNEEEWVLKYLENYEKFDKDQKNTIERFIADNKINIDK